MDLGAASLTERFWEIEETQASEFRRLGLKQRYFFPHQLRYLRRPGSDGFRLAQRMYGLEDPSQFRELVLHAAPAALREFPSDLFFDRDIIWHQQHLGVAGHVAVADLAVDGRRLCTTARFSDVVQRISRRRDLKTRIENVLRGWDQMLLNGIVHFAVEHGLDEIWFPTAELARENTDRKRHPEAAMFERLYDRHLVPYRPRREGRHWVVETRHAATRLVQPRRCEKRADLAHTICLLHDTERGLGYRGIDDGFAAQADQFAPQALTEMLAVERSAAVATTYNVVGTLVGELRAEIEADRHALAFHSYDHCPEGDQLAQCRAVDYRLPGYRPAQSRLYDGIGDARLAFHNFEWLASSIQSFGFDTPCVQGGVVKLPILTDDHPLHTGQFAYPEWRRRILAAAAQGPFTALGLHDCYAPHWLPHYPELLDRLKDCGSLSSLDALAQRIARANAE